MLKKLSLITISAINLTVIGYGQKNNVYAELGGAGYSMTLNYERMLNDNILVRMGYGSGKGKTDDGTSNNSKVSFMPLGAAYLMGSGDHKFELGGGMTMLQGTLEMDGEYIESNSIFFGGGYRYQMGTGGFLFNLKAYYLTIGRFSSPWAGMSVGWTL
tara:strand:+ start:144 stop:617 length:474 start_codon:yes stop_codon:yes gene_type:complete